MNSLPETVTRQRRGCDLNPGPSAPESRTLSSLLMSHPYAIPGSSPYCGMLQRKPRICRTTAHCRFQNSQFIQTLWITKCRHKTFVYALLICIVKLSLVKFSAFIDSFCVHYCRSFSVITANKVICISAYHAADK